MRVGAKHNNQIRTDNTMSSTYTGILLSTLLAMQMAVPVFAQAPVSPPRAERATPLLPARVPASPPAPVFRPGQGAGNEAPPPLYAPSVTEDEIAVLVVAGEETTLSSQMAGRIQRVNVGLGDTVAQNATLVEFDCSEQQAQLQAAQAEYRGLRETHLTKLKLQALGAAGELEVTVAAAAADKARSQMDLRDSQMAYCQVKAPFPGRVARLRVKISESLNLGQPVVELVNPATLKAQMFVPSSFIRLLKPGAVFQVKLESGQTYRAQVSRINSRVEGVSQQLEVEGRFEGTPTGLLPGMVGTAVFAGRNTGKR